MKSLPKIIFGLLILIIFFLVINVKEVEAQVTQQQACTGSGCSLRCGICIGNNNCALNQPAVSNNPYPGYTHFCLKNSDCTNVYQGIPSIGTTFYGSVKRCGEEVPIGTQMTISNCGYTPTFQVFSFPGYYAYTTNTDSVGNWLRDGSLNGETLNFYVRDPILRSLIWLGRYTYDTSFDPTEFPVQLNWDYCPVTPTPTPTLPPVCPLKLSSEAGSLKYTFNNEWKYYVSFTPSVAGKVDKVSVKVGNWGNALRSVSCKVTNNTGTQDISLVKSSASFANGSGADWRVIIDFKSNPFNLQANTQYRLYCKGPDSWGSLYWIYNQSNNPNSKTYRIYMCP